MIPKLKLTGEYTAGVQLATLNGLAASSSGEA